MFSLLPSYLIYRGLFLFTFEDNFYFNFSVSFTVFFYCNNLFSYGFFFPFFLLLKDSFKIIFSQHAIGAYFGFRNYPRILCTSGSFSFHLWGHFFSFSFFLPSFLSTPGGEEGKLCNFWGNSRYVQIFLSAYQSSFTRGAYLTARAFSFAVGVSRWEIGPTEADGLPMQLPTVLGTCHVFLVKSHPETWNTWY